MEIVPEDDRTNSAPFTFMEFTTLNEVRGMIGNVMRSVLEKFMELWSRSFDFYISLQLSHKRRHFFLQMIFPVTNHLIAEKNWKSVKEMLVEKGFSQYPLYRINHCSVHWHFVLYNPRIFALLIHTFYLLSIHIALTHCMGNHPLNYWCYYWF